MKQTHSTGDLAAKVLGRTGHYRFAEHVVAQM